MNVQEQTDRPHFSGVFMQVVYKYRKHLVIVGLLSIILSSIFSSSFFITPLYKSEVILYPTASKSISKALLSETFGSTKDILEFGEEEQTEQMLQVLNSNRIRDRVIKKYNLLDHYNISDKSKYKMTTMYNDYESNFNFRRTEYMAVKITVLDKSAQMAADMANDIAELVDSTINQMQKEVARKAFRIVETEYHSLKDEVQVLEDSLTKLRELGVYDYESQSEMFNRQLAIEMAKGNKAGVKRLEERLDVLAKYGGPYVSIRDALLHDKKQLSEIKGKYDEAKVDATEDLPHKFIVSNAYKAEKKSYPIRWLIVVISTFSALFLAVVIFGGSEVFSGNLSLEIKKKNIKSKILRAPIFAEARNENRPIAEKVEKQTTQEKKEDIKPPADAKEPGKEEKISKPINEEVETKIRKEKPVSEGEYKNTEMDNFFNSSNLLNLLNKWKYHLLIIVSIAAILAIIFSSPMFITPMFKSHAVVYPGNVVSYSDESETEQMLQIMNSQDIIDSTIDKFDLARHYEIDRDYEYFRTALLDEYNQNVKISKTLYESVLIEVFDKDADTAKLMVNSILDFYNKKVGRLHKTKYQEVVTMYADQLSRKRQNLDSLKQIMYELGTEYGLFEYEYQSQEIMRGYLKTLTGSGADRVNNKEVKRLLESMESKSGQLIEVVQMIQDESRSYVEVKLDYELALRFLNAEMTYSNIISEPFVSDKKSYPVRWLIVVVVTIAAFVFSLLAILFIEKRKQLV